jgi:hypothetical protein
MENRQPGSSHSSANCTTGLLPPARWGSRATPGNHSTGEKKRGAASRNPTSGDVRCQESRTLPARPAWMPEVQSETRVSRGCTHIAVRPWFKTRPFRHIQRSRESARLLSDCNDSTPCRQINSEFSSRDSRKYHKLGYNPRRHRGHHVSPGSAPWTTAPSIFSMIC